jgi:hypothetical protein
MQMHIRKRGVEVNEKLRVSLKERLRASLGRFARYIREVWVYLWEVNDPRGSAGLNCRIVVHVPSDGRVVVTGRDAEIDSVIHRTTARAWFAVRRHLKRKLALRRRPRQSTARAGRATRTRLRAQARK